MSASTATDRVEYGRTTLIEDHAPALPSRVSWGAIAAGALIAVAVGATLNILGLAIGATTVDAVDRDTPSAAALGMGAGIWLLVANLIALAVGGWVAARLSGTGDAKDAALHGLGVWASAFLVSAVLLGSVVAGTASTAGSALSSMIGGAARIAGSAAGVAEGQVDAEALVERARIALTGPTDPALMSAEQRAAEIGALIAKRLAEGRFEQADRQRLATLIGAAAGIPTDEAERRVQAYEAEARRVAADAERRAREAADAAASGAATGAFWVFAALLLGAIAAAVGAGAGRRKLAVSSASMGTRGAL